MANVTATNGRRTREDFDLLFLLADFMLERGEFLLHIAHLHVTGGAARTIQKIDDSAGQAADQNDGEADEPNHPGHGRWNRAKVEEHDLKDELARPDPGETDRQR